MEGLTEAETRKLEANWQSFNKDALNIPSLRAVFMVNHYKSFIGKHMKIVIQAAPFVFFPLMNRQQRDLWMSMCYLCTLVYQTKIDDMERYIEDLQCHIDIFLYHVLSMTAQWVNKPKFHMLLHLPESVRRFGPPSLFSSEKFESYNGIMRNASIHSNRQAPGRDIANTFSNYQAMRLILSGVFLYNHTKHYFFIPSKNVTDVFKFNKEVQKLMGIDLTEPIRYPILYNGVVSGSDEVAPPCFLFENFPATKWIMVSSIKTDEHDIVQEGMFVLVSWKFLLLRWPSLMYESNAMCRYLGPKHIQLLHQWYQFGKQHIPEVHFTWNSKLTSLLESMHFTKCGNTVTPTIISMPELM